jgi:hypothetical protein
MDTGRHTNSERNSNVSEPGLSAPIGYKLASLELWIAIFSQTNLLVSVRWCIFEGILNVRN